MDSGHAYEAEVANRETQTTGLLRRAYYDKPIKGPTSRTFGTIGRTDDQYMPAWQRQLAEIARDPAGQLAAKEMIAGANRGEDIETASENATKEVARYLRDPAQAGRASRFLRSNDAITMAPIGQTRWPIKMPLTSTPRQWFTRCVVRYVAWTVLLTGACWVRLPRVAR